MLATEGAVGETKEEARGEGGVVDAEGYRFDRRCIRSDGKAV